MVNQYPPDQQIPGTVYRVVRHLATGGMGSVYDVEDVTVGKRYVLKTLHPNLVARQDLAKRMSAEARTLARLQHPNIVDVVTAGITQDAAKIPFYVMERLNGQNLRVVIEKKGAFELTRAYRIGMDVLEALEHAHENQVIHRDVKPENIFLHRNPNGTTITKLLDFGIMRLLDRKASHTQGKFVGTLRYASPEQIMGEELGPATDIYSMGLVIYEMLCGRGPFDDLPDAYAIGAAHAQKAPPPLSRFRGGLPPALEQLVLSSLAKRPADRPPDCFGYARELRRMLKEEEDAPRSTTAVNVLTYAPETAAVPGASSDDLPPAFPTATLQAPPPSGGARPATQPTGPTVAAEGLGPSPPETVAVRVGPGAAPPSPAPETPAVDASPAAEPAADGLALAATQAFVDRSADTRVAHQGPRTQRLPMHGTELEEGGGLPDLDVLRAALGEVQRLEVPPESYDRPASSGDIRFPPQFHHSSYPGTGPTSGEGVTRPPERSLVGPLLAVAGVVLLVGGAGAAVLKLGLPSRAGASPAASATSAPTVAPVAAPSPSQAVAASASPVAATAVAASASPADAPAATAVPAAPAASTAPAAVAAAPTTHATPHKAKPTPHVPTKPSAPAPATRPTVAAPVTPATTSPPKPIRPPDVPYD